jgi:hypothetical protein
LTAVRGGQVVERIAVEIGQGDAVRGLHEGAGRGQSLAQEPAVLERHPVKVGELQIGKALAGRGGRPNAFGKARAVERGEPRKARLAALDHIGRRVVRAEELPFVVMAGRDPGSDAARHARMSGQRPVLAARELKPALDGRDRTGHGGGPEPVERDVPSHRISIYRTDLTAA